jgi:predicted RNase H-like HicB family nuclease
MKKITGEYKFIIFKDGDYFIAKARIGQDDIIVTQGKTEDEIFDMLADAYKVALDIEISWWNKILGKLMHYGQRKT